MASDSDHSPTTQGQRFTVLGDVKSFFLDTKDQRAHRQAMKAQAKLSHGTQGSPAASHSTATPGTAHSDRPSVKPPSKVSRRARLLGGKRGRAVLMMVVAIATVILTVVNTIFLMTRPSRADIKDEVAAQLRESGQEFPSGQAVAWADQAVVDWATWNEDDRDEREVRMAQYLTSGMDAQAGWGGGGKQEVVFTSTNPEPDVIDANHALVHVDYRLSDKSRRCVSVPVYAFKPEGITGEHVQWAFALSANPVPRPCAPRTGALTPPESSRGDDGLKENDELARTLSQGFFPDFFAAWAASDTASLRQFTAPGVTTIGLGGAMTSTPPPSITEAVIRTPEEGAVDGEIYTATVPVTWTVAGSTASVTATYDVPMKTTGDRWYVAGEPQPSSTSVEADSGVPAPTVAPEESATEPDSSPTPTPTPNEGG